MAGLNNPDAFALVCFAPDQIAGCAHQCLEDFGEVARVQHQQAHALQYALLYARHNGVTNFAVGHVPPPSEHIRFGQHRCGQPVVGLVQCGHTHLHALLAQMRSDRCVQAVWIHQPYSGIRFFVAILVPDCDANCHELLQSRRVTRCILPVRHSAWQICGWHPTAGSCAGQLPAGTGWASRCAAPPETAPTRPSSRAPEWAVAGGCH